MKKVLFAFFLFTKIFGFEPLPNEYLVTYGSPEASTKITQYYSFTCPHCLALFRSQFQEIKERFIDTDTVYWVFHPVPMDLPTVQAMDCLEKLSAHEKRIFLEAILEEVVIERPQISVLLMQKGMEVLKKPITRLSDQAYLSDTNAFLDAFNFLKQERQLKAVPAVEANGILIPDQVPDIAFLETLLRELQGDTR